MSRALPAESSARARRLLPPLAWTALLLTFVVVVASAFIRHTQAGLDCADWPACYATALAEPDAQTPSTGVRVARALHRLGASIALLAIFGTVLLARIAGDGSPKGLRSADSVVQHRGGPSDSRTRRLAVAALVLALGLAVLGVATRGATLPAVPLGNLVGGYLLLAVLAALAGSVAGPASESQRATPARVQWLACALLGLVLVQAAVGGLIGTQSALRACATLDRCEGAVGDALAAGAALDPFRRPAVVAGQVVPPPGAGGLHTLHRALGIAVTLAAWILAFALRTSQRRAAVLLAVLALAAVLLGATAILRMPSLAATVLHNAAAAACVATLGFVLARRAAQESGAHAFCNSSTAFGAK